MVTMGTTSTMTGALLPAIVRDLGLDAAQAGLLVSSPGVGYVISVALAGVLGDRLGFHRIWLTGVVMGLVALLGITAAPSLLWLLPPIAGLGLVVGFFDGSINPLVTTTAESRSGGTLNLVHSFFGVGATTGPFLVSLGLQRGLIWRWHYAALTLYLMMVGATILAFRISSRPRGARGEHVPLSRALASRPVLLGALAMLIYGGVEACLFSWTAFYLVRERAVAASMASLAVSAFGGALLLGRFTCGQVVERIGYKRLIVGGSFVGAVGVLLFIGLPGQTLPWLGVALAGLSWAGIFATVVADVSQRVPERAGTAAGLVCPASGVGKIALPWLLGQVAQATSLPMGFGLVAIFALLMGILYAFA